MSETQPNNPLHGITLKVIVERLVDYYGWEQLGLFVEINCFNYKPSLTSSLRFLRKTPWARAKVERLYIIMQDRIEQDQQAPDAPPPNHYCNGEVEPVDSSEPQHSPEVEPVDSSEPQQHSPEVEPVDSSEPQPSSELDGLDEAKDQKESRKFKFEFRAKKESGLTR